MARDAQPTGARPQRSVDDGQVIALVDANYQHSLRYHHTFYSKLSSWYNVFRSVSRRPSEFRNNISIPFVFAMVQSDVARKVQTSLSAWPIVTFSGYAPEDSARAKKNEILVSAQMKDADSISKGVDFFLTADLYGVAIARYGWKNITRRNRIRRRHQIGPGLSIPVAYEYDAEFFDGPNWEPIDPLDVKVQPGKRRIEDMSWLIHEYWADLDDLLEESASEHPYFERSKVLQLTRYPLDMGATSQMDFRAGTYRNQFDYMARRTEKFAKPVHIKERWGLVPDEFAPDGIRTRCIAVANDRVVLLNREMPFWDQQKPFLSYAPMPDPSTFYAPGKVEIAEKLSQAANRLANQKLDVLDHIVDPQYVMSSSAGINKDNLFSRAGRIILVDGSADDSNIRPLTPDTRGFQATYAEISTLWSYMQLGGGINDIVMGLPAAERETARGFLGRQENTLTRLSLEARLAEEQFLEPLANAFRKMDQWWLALPKEIKILGSIATINPITGLPYPQQPETVDYDDLVPDYRARAVGASQMIGRSIRQQNFLGLLQMMSSNPVLLQLVNWSNFARQAFELFDFSNVNELLVNTVPQINQVAQEGGQSPEQVAGTVSQPLDQLNPEILGALMGAQAQQPMGALTNAGY